VSAGYTNGWGKKSTLRRVDASRLVILSGPPGKIRAKRMPDACLLRNLQDEADFLFRADWSYRARRSPSGSSRRCTRRVASGYHQRTPAAWKKSTPISNVYGRRSKAATHHFEKALAVRRYNQNGRPSTT